MRKFIVALLLGCLSFFSFAQQPLQVNVSLSKASYLYGAPIDIYMEYKNTSDSIIRSADISPVNMRLINDRGEIVAYRWSVPFYIAPRHNYQPNESDNIALDLTELYGSRKFSKAVTAYLESGAYILEISSATKKGEIRQTRIEFKVIEPVGEELLVHNKFQEIIRDMDRQGCQNDEKIEELVRLHESYPNSVYSTNLLGIIEAFYKFLPNGYEKAKLYVREIIEKYTVSSMAVGFVLGELQGKKTRQEKVEFLRMIKRNSKNTGMEKIYGKLLEEELAK